MSAPASRRSRRLTKSLLVRITFAMMSLVACVLADTNVDTIEINKYNDQVDAWLSEVGSADLSTFVVVADVSGSIGSDGVELVRDTAASFARTVLSLKPSTTGAASPIRVTLTCYSDKVHPIPPFSSDAEQLTAAARSLPFMAANTNTALALKEVLNFLKKESVLATDSSRTSSLMNYVVLITDGQPDDEKLALQAADMLKAHQVEIITIAVGVDSRSLRRMASSTALHFDVANLANLKSIFAAALAERLPIYITGQLLGVPIRMKEDVTLRLCIDNKSAHVLKAKEHWIEIREIVPPIVPDGISTEAYHPMELAPGRSHFMLARAPLTADLQANGGRVCEDISLEATSNADVFSIPEALSVQIMTINNKPLRVQMNRINMQSEWFTADFYDLPSEFSRINSLCWGFWWCGKSHTINVITNAFLEQSVNQQKQFISFASEGAGDKAHTVRFRKYDPSTTNIHQSKQFPFVFTDAIGVERPLNYLANESIFTEVVKGRTGPSFNGTTNAELQVYRLQLQNDGTQIDSSRDRAHHVSIFVRADALGTNNFENDVKLLKEYAKQCEKMDPPVPVIWIVTFLNTIPASKQKTHFTKIVSALGVAPGDVYPIADYSEHRFGPLYRNFRRDRISLIVAQRIHRDGKAYLINSDKTGKLLAADKAYQQQLYKAAQKRRAATLDKIDNNNSASDSAPVQSPMVKAASDSVPVHTITPINIHKAGNTSELVPVNSTSTVTSDKIDASDSMPYGMSQDWIKLLRSPLVNIGPAFAAFTSTIVLLISVILLRKSDKGAAAPPASNSNGPQPGDDDNNDDAPAPDTAPDSPRAVAADIVDPIVVPAPVVAASAADEPVAEVQSSVAPQSGNEPGGLNLSSSNCSLASNPSDAASKSVPNDHSASDGEETCNEDGAQMESTADAVAPALALTMLSNASKPDCS